MITFDVAFERVIGHEGGYVNDPNDPGGETKFGISRRAYPQLNIAALTRDDARAIYRRDFWEPLARAGVPPALLFQVFDFAVNSGSGTAIRALQRALDVAPDGRFGPVSAAAAARADPLATAVLLLAERLEFMTRLSNWPHHGRGWARRVAHNMRLAVADTRRTSQ